MQPPDMKKPAPGSHARSRSGSFDYEAAGDSLGSTDGLDRSGLDRSGLDRSGLVSTGGTEAPTDAPDDAAGLLHAEIAPIRANASRILLIMETLLGM
jgi:hypothetical protein